MSEKQKTINKEVQFEGSGIHSGRAVRVTVKPAPAGHGICFLRSDVPQSEKVRAIIENVEQLQGRQTTLKGKGWKIQTIEHLMAVFHGLSIDNALVEVSGEELPALDGSAKPYVDGILKAGLKEQDAERSYVNITTPAYFFDKDCSIAVFPAEQFQVSYTLCYAHPDLSDQFFTTVMTPDIFCSDIAPSRTFCLKEEAERLQKLGYGQGANVSNTLVFEKNLPIQNSLRFPNEACRHKILDLLGDFALVGQPFKAHIVASRTGHSDNLALARQLADLRSIPVLAEGKEAAFPDLSMPGEWGAETVKKVLPHRFPFLFLDRVLEMTPGKRIVGLKQVKRDEFFFQGHFPGHPVMPGVLIIEALAQCGGFLMLSKPENRGKIAYFMTIQNAKFRQPVMPGDQLRFEAEVVRERTKTGECVGKAYVGEKLVCETEVRFAVVDATSPEKPVSTKA